MSRHNRLSIQRVQGEGPNYQIIDVESMDTIAYVNWFNINGERPFSLSGDMEIAKGYDNDKLVLNLRENEGNSFEGKPYASGGEIHISGD